MFLRTGRWSSTQCASSLEDVSSNTTKTQNHPKLVKTPKQSELKPNIQKHQFTSTKHFINMFFLPTKRPWNLRATTFPKFEDLCVFRRAQLCLRPWPSLHLSFAEEIPLGPAIGSSHSRANSICHNQKRSKMTNTNIKLKNLKRTPCGETENKKQSKHCTRCTSTSRRRASINQKENNHVFADSDRTKLSKTGCFFP